ncbi:hypothetical protein NQD34_007616 [Periophthalmus magnuspinnatus]|nr:hypothetical protein NQD34_007616 [Periophthalmus magnuspinnatus]
MLVKLHHGASSSDQFVDLSNKNLSFVPRDLPHTVEYLDLSCNHIRQLHGGDFRDTTQLKFLNMSWNILETIDPEAFMNTLLLQKLDLSHNKLTNLEDQKYLQHTGNLLVLHLDQNQFINMTLGEEFRGLKNLERLTIEAKQIRRDDFMHISELKLVEMFLYHLNFSYCALSDSIFYRVVDEKIIECKNLRNVKTLNLVDNNLKNFQIISKRIQYMISLEKLDVSQNSLVYDGFEECLWSPNITTMILSSNSLTENVFNCMPKHIKILDLENNQVSVVPSTVIKFQNLVSINLNSNRLRDLPVCKGFPMLNTLLLKSNSLHAPSVQKLESCPLLNILDISHNPFTCICSLRQFRNLGMKSERNGTKVNILNWPSGYYCLYPEKLRNTTLRDASIPEISCNTGLLAATILCPAIFTIIAIVVACHHFDVPWYMGMILQWTRAKHRARRQNIPIEDLVGVEFHAFASFSQHNAEWVHNSMLPNLSELRICHHEKHFMPGRTIIDNIMNCVQKSRRSVFVLSAHFVKSEWCHYELYFATHQRQARGPDSVVLVLLEPLPEYLIPSKYHQLKSMMRRHTYLEWPQEKAKQRLFWANLRAALQSNIPSAPATELEE